MERKSEEVHIANLKAEVAQLKAELSAQAEMLRQLDVKSLLEANMEIRQQKEEILTQAEELRQVNEALSSSHDNLQALTALGKKINEDLSIGNILRKTAHGIYTLVPVDLVGIALFNEERDVLEFRVFDKKNEQTSQEILPITQKHPAVDCFLKQTSLLFNQIQAEQPEYGLAERDCQSRIYIPLIYEEKRLGVLTVQLYDPSAYNEYKLQVLRNLSVYLSNAIDNAQTHELIEQKNRETMSSINYAQRIQAAILPNEQEIESLLGGNAFVLFRPRDVVSGDFYWAAQVEGKTIIAAIDCTGHGVPGALMSMIGDTLLNEIIKTEKNTAPDYILYALHKQIRNTLRQEVTDNQDGMDVAICTIDPQAQTLSFAGAKNPLIYFEGETLKLIKGSRASIGGQQRKKQLRQEDFQVHKISLGQPMSFYIFSDGYQDQFGGDKDRKIGAKRLRSLFSKVHHLPMDAQKTYFEKYLRKWMGKSKQIDDILLIGFRLGVSKVENDSL